MQDRGDKRQVEALANAMRLLDEQLRDQKAIVGRLEVQEERLNGQFDTILGRLEALTTGHETLSAHVKIGSESQDLIHLLNDQVAALIDRQRIVEARVEDFHKQRLSTLERERVERDGALRRLEASEKTTANWQARITVIEEIARRMQESTALVGQKLERIDTAIESLTGRGGRNLEAAKRLETELRQVGALVDTLQRQDDTVLERVQLLNEVVRRVEDRIALLSSQEARYQEILDKIELQRVERLRIEEALSRVERVADEQAASIANLQHQAATIEGRSRGLIERMEHLGEEIEHFSELITGQIQRFTQVQERHKRRQIQDIETEIRDLKRHIIVTEAGTTVEQQPAHQG